MGGKYQCGVCKEEKYGPMLKDPLWELLAELSNLPGLNHRKHMCLECMDGVLGRPIVRADLEPVPFNGFFGRWIEDSSVLEDR